MEDDFILWTVCIWVCDFLVVNTLFVNTHESSRMKCQIIKLSFCINQLINKKKQNFFLKCLAIDDSNCMNIFSCYFCSKQNSSVGSLAGFCEFLFSFCVSSVIVLWLLVVSGWVYTKQVHSIHMFHVPVPNQELLP